MAVRWRRGKGEGGEPDPARDAARYRVERDAGALPDATGAQDVASPTAEQVRAARAARMADRASWVDRVVDRAIADGQFDHNPYAGRPLPGIDGRHDPDWWVKGLVEREGITGVLPEALQLRKDEASLREALDREASPEGVRRRVLEFNRRVVEARRQLRGGPPVVTDLRDVEAEVDAWRERRAR